MPAGSLGQNRGGVSEPVSGMGPSPPVASNLSKLCPSGHPTLFSGSPQGKPRLWVIQSLLTSPSSPLSTPCFTHCPQPCMLFTSLHFCTGLGCPSLPSLPCPPSNLNSNVISFLGPALKDRGAGFFLCNYILLSLFMVSEGCLSIYVAVSTLFVLLYLAGTLWVLSVCVCVTV